MPAKGSMRVYPASSILDSNKEQIVMLMHVYGMTHEQAHNHTKLYGLGALYITDGARIDSEYQVIVNKGHSVPQQGAAGADIAQVSIRRIDGKREPIHWQDLQEIKARLFGHDYEGVELFPMRKREVDSPFRHLWIFPKGTLVPLGYIGGPSDQFDPKIEA